VTPRDVYLARAEVAYGKYMKVQAAIEVYEADAKAKYENSSLAAQRLKSGEQYWRYRELCSDRAVHMAVAQLNASMAAAIPQ
jgi:hypothetical protein